MQLRDYQERISNEAVVLLREHHIAYLSMEVRVGKTLTALEAARKYGATWVLFVTRKKAMSSIKKKEDDDPEGDFDKLNPGYKFTIINYESVHKLHAGYEFDFIILDEAHCLSQYPSVAERTKLLKNICKGLPVIYLSGTPSPESYSQLYHQFWISSFSPFAAWSTFYKWAAEFVTVKKKFFYNRQINDYSTANKEKIDELTKHLFISYSQEDAGFTEYVKEEILYVDMWQTTYALAEKLRTKRIHIGKEGQEILADTTVKLLNKMHQVFSGTVLTEDGKGVVFDYTKAKFIKEHFADRKIAIFYKFKAEYGMLIWTFGIDKLTSDPQEFNASPDLIFVSQIQSGREGINLSTADALVMLNIDYSAVSYWQARARMQSKERTKEAMLYWIFSRGGIEEKIHAAVHDKKDYTLNYFKKDFKTKTNDARTEDRTALLPTGS